VIRLQISGLYDLPPLSALLRPLPSLADDCSPSQEESMKSELLKAQPGIWGLFAKYVVSFVGLVVFVLAVNGALELSITYRDTTTTVAAQQTQRAEAIADRIMQSISEMERQISWATRASSITVEQHRADYNLLLQQVPAVEELVHLGGDGRERLRVTRRRVTTDAGTDYSRDPMFTEAVGQGIWYSPVYYRGDSEPFMTIALAHSGRNAGVTVAEINLSFLSDQVSSLQSGRSGYAYVVGPLGRLLTHTDSKLVSRSSDFSRLPQVEAARAGRVVTSGKDTDGSRVVAAFAPIARMNWLVFVEQPMREALGPVRDFVFRRGWLLILGLVVSVIAGTILTRRMIGPVGALQGGALRLGVQSLVNNLQPLLHSLLQRRGAARAQHQVSGLSEPPPLPGGAPADAAAAPVDAAAAPADSAVEPADTAVEPTGTPVAPAETAGATAEVASEPAETADATAEAASAPAETADATTEADSAPAETADATAEAASAPAEMVTAPVDTTVEPIGTSVASAETADATIDAASAPAETSAAPTDAAVEPAGGLVAPSETTAAPTETALRSMLDATLSAGLDGALGMTLRASAGTSNGAAPVPGAEIAQPPERRLFFPLVAPSHVPALNAVYRRRPPLAATIGGRQATIIAAWQPPDRRPDVSHRVALRLDGEPGELWLSQALLDVLVASVDPALSLDRLGPEQAAIILEFALDSALAAVEMNLGCTLAIDSVSGKLEQPENVGQPALFFSLVVEGLVTAGCELRLPPDYALRLAEGLDRHAGISRSALDLPMPVCLRVAAASLTAGEIERLAPDDVVLVDARCQPGDSAIAVIGERLVAPVALAPEGHRLAARPIPGGNSPWAWSMASDAAPLEGNNDNRPLHVMFEIGRFELSVSKVKQLAPNAPLPLGTLHDETVDIVVDGQRIGRGTLMQIGNRIGVHVTKRTPTPRSWREMRSSRKPR
jgi:type III secretion system YscQ/HrcQ family protein